MTGILRYAGHALRLACIFGVVVSQAACGPPGLRELTVEQIRPVARRDDALLLVFSTDTDLASYWPRYGATVGMMGQPCTLHQRGDPHLTEFGAVLSEDGMVLLDVREVTGPASLPAGPDGRFRFSFWLGITNEFRFPRPGGSDLHFIPWDLRRDTDDLCFRIHGGSLRGGHRSPVFRLPHATIAEALRQDRPR